MLPSRQTAILEIAKQRGRVLVDELAAQFAVTPQTIRKDLNDLCDRKLMARTHGGAILASGIENVGYEARSQIAAREKTAIAQAVAARIPNDASLFINIGTTTEAVAQALLQHHGLMVITNNINVAHIMRPYPQIEVVIVGGVVRSSDGGIVGEAAIDFIRQFKVDYAIVGTSAIDADGSLLDFDFREVKVAQAILANSRHVVLAADSTKLARTAPVRIGSLQQVHTFVTDFCPSDSVRAFCAAHDVELVEALPDAAPAPD